MTGPLRVVIAEDSAVLRDGLVQLLVDRGFVITGAVSDPEALRRSVELNKFVISTGRFAFFANLEWRDLHFALALAENAALFTTATQAPVAAQSRTAATLLRQSNPAGPSAPLP